MINPKNICICSGVGFCLSFFVGLFSGVHFANVLFRAVLFALLFGVLCIGFTFIYKKFLSIDTGSFSSDADAAQPKPVAGSVVNIVVDDSGLADDAQAPQFAVANSSPSMGFGGDLAVSEDERKDQKIELDDINAAPAPKPSAEPVKTEPAAAEPVAAAPAPVSAAAPSQEPPAHSQPQTARETASFSPANLGTLTGGSAPEKDSEQNNLDELPDIGEMSIENAAESDRSSPMSETEVINDSEFATGGASFKESTNQDTSVMAKAIQTLLAKDND